MASLAAATSSRPTAPCLHQRQAGRGASLVVRSSIKKSGLAELGERERKGGLQVCGGPPTLYRTPTPAH